MFLWQNIDLDPAEVIDIQSRYLQVLPNNPHFFQKIDIGLTHFLGLEVQKFVLIQVAPNARGRIHTDWRPSDYGHQLALQIPLYNCENSITELWSSDYTPPTQYTDNGQPYNYYERDRCIKISEFKLVKPVIFRTDVPHSVNNTNTKIRQAISIRFKEDPWHLVNTP